ncbi:transducin/WD40 repeat-like superfamily protein [Actinidia rufa]|uniref:Transducin/WD40 repeat-like superfamily protein n=1 Tax=Actinidia rufa TaxID=165716 RepID=A0A7J0F5Y1_9ERIC|nr:transducin/WD40 repeat-like superfamily protein [Actinidia rufa]
MSPTQTTMVVPQLPFLLLRTSSSVIGRRARGRAPTKIKTDLKKPIVNLACHPRHPLLYVAYADGLIRAYDIHSYAVHYTLHNLTTPSSSLVLVHLRFIQLWNGFLLAIDGVRFWLGMSPLRDQV